MALIAVNLEEKLDMNEKDLMTTLQIMSLLTRKDIQNFFISMRPNYSSKL